MRETDITICGLLISTVHNADLQLEAHLSEKCFILIPFRDIICLLCMLTHVNYLYESLFHF